METIQGGDYESCKNMIYKLARDRYNLMKKRRADVEFEDVLSEAMYVYSLCLTTYKNGKGMKFSTYLYQNLVARLRDFYNHTFKEFITYEDWNMTNGDRSSAADYKRYEDNIISREYEIDEHTEEFLEVAKEELSYEGYIVLKYIVSMEWQKGRTKNLPANTWLANHFGYSLELTNSIMSEIRNFWNEQGYLVA